MSTYPSSSAPAFEVMSAIETGQPERRSAASNSVCIGAPPWIVGNRCCTAPGAPTAYEKSRLALHG